jgi:hypothetical protein
MAQPLFANQREANLASIVTLVESVLGELYPAHPPDRVDAAEPVLHAWRVAQGSATAIVALVARPEFTHLRISSIVMTLDGSVDRPALYAHLLELNGSLCGNAFALEGDRVLLVAERSTLDLDHSELVDLVRRVTTNADSHDDALVAVFGGRLGG